MENNGLAFIWFGWHSTHSPAHSYKTTEVLLQTFIGFLIKSGKSSELVPIKLLLHRVKNNSKSRYNTIKICFLSSCPPKNKEISTSGYFQSPAEYQHVF